MGSPLPLSPELATSFVYRPTGHRNPLTELDKLKKQLFHLSALVEECLKILAVNIAGIQPRLKSEHSPAIFGDSLQALGVKAQIMLRQSLESLMNMDTAGARKVLVADDEVDLDYKNFIGILKKEHAADLATNIAEDTICRG